MNKTNDNNEELLLDARGLYCPEPVMLLHKKIREMGHEDIVKVLATDPSTKRDIPKFCHFLGHTLLSTAELEKEFEYLIQKNDNDSSSDLSSTE